MSTTAERAHELLIKCLSPLSDHADAHRDFLHERVEYSELLRGYDEAVESGTITQEAL